jgi:hypothetical protein
MSKNTDFYEREIDGFDGPFVNMYLKRFTPGYSKKKYKTLEEVLEVAKENKYCLGITLSRQGDFTLRLGKELKVSDKTNKFKYKEISWKKKEEIKNIFVEGKGKKEEQFEIIKYGNENIKLTTDMNTTDSKQRTHTANKRLAFVSVFDRLLVPSLSWTIAIVLHTSSP